MGKTQTMTTRTILFAAAVIAAALPMQSSAQALTITECSAKYKDAKAAGTLNGATWNDSRKSQCDAGGSGGTAKRAPAARGGTTVVADVVFPSTVDSKYSNERPGRARRKTCLDQYKANKTPKSATCVASMAAEGWWLLQPMRQEAKGHGVEPSGNTFPDTAHRAKARPRALTRYCWCIAEPGRFHALSF
jgi:hypothetical protein